MDLQAATNQIKQTHLELTEETDFSIHNAALNKRLSGLVSGLCSWHAQGLGKALLADPTLAPARHALPTFCAKAECEMELGWAQRFLANPQLTVQSLKEFWYYQNYEQIVLDELALMATHTPNTKGLTFVGSGPLPLSVIITALHQPDWQFECVDADLAACNISRQLIARLGLQGRIKVTHALAQAHAYNPSFATMVASLITHKDQAYDQLANCGLKQFMVRDAEDVFQFLYTPAAEPLNALWQCVGQTHTSSTRINTTKVYQQLSM